MSLGGHNRSNDYAQVDIADLVVESTVIQSHDVEEPVSNIYTI